MIIFNYKNYPEVTVSSHLKKIAEPEINEKIYKRILEIVKTKSEEI